MTKDEREAFLADLHVGVIAVERREGPPLAVPIWYDYVPGGDLWVLTSKDSVKGRLLQKAERFSLCAQVEEAPMYRYVSVEGPVVEIVEADREDDSRPMAHRYFGAELGDQYIGASDAESPSMKFVMRPERWWSVDYRKLA